MLLPEQVKNLGVWIRFALVGFDNKFRLNLQLIPAQSSLEYVFGIYLTRKIGKDHLKAIPGVLGNLLHPEEQI